MTTHTRDARELADRLHETSRQGAGALPKIPNLARDLADLVLQQASAIDELAAEVGELRRQVAHLLAEHQAADELPDFATDPGGTA